MTANMYMMSYYISLVSPISLFCLFPVQAFALLSLGWHCVMLITCVNIAFIGFHFIA